MVVNYPVFLEVIFSERVKVRKEIHFWGEAIPQKLNDIIGNYKEI